MPQEIKDDDGQLIYCAACHTHLAIKTVEFDDHSLDLCSACAATSEAQTK